MVLSTYIFVRCAFMLNLEAFLAYSLLFIGGLVVGELKEWTSKRFLFYFMVVGVICGVGYIFGLVGIIIFNILYGLLNFGLEICLYKNGWSNLISLFFAGLAAIVSIYLLSSFFLGLGAVNYCKPRSSRLGKRGVKRRSIKGGRKPNPKKPGGGVGDLLSRFASMGIEEIKKNEDIVIHSYFNQCSFWQRVSPHWDGKEHKIQCLKWSIWCDCSPAKKFFVNFSPWHKSEEGLNLRIEQYTPYNVVCLNCPTVSQYPKIDEVQVYAVEALKRDWFIEVLRGWSCHVCSSFLDDVGPGVSDFDSDFRCKAFETITWL